MSVERLDTVSNNVPAKGFPRSGLKEDVIDVVEVCEIGIYFDDPVWDGEYDSSDEKSTPPFR